MKLLIFKNLTAGETIFLTVGKIPCEVVSFHACLLTHNEAKNTGNS
jgi:hypothetical protein